MGLHHLRHITTHFTIIPICAIWGNLSSPRPDVFRSLVVMLVVCILTHWLCTFLGSPHGSHSVIARNIADLTRGPELDPLGLTKQVSHKIFPYILAWSIHLKAESKTCMFRIWCWCAWYAFAMLFIDSIASKRILPDQSVGKHDTPKAPKSETLVSWQTYKYEPRA